MLVRVGDVEVARVTVHLAMASGNLVGVAKLMRHGGVASEYGCMKCLIDTKGKQYFTRTITNFCYRTIEQLKAPLPPMKDNLFNIKDASILTTLKSFPANPAFYGLDTLYYLSLGSAKHLYALLLSPLHQSKGDIRNTPSVKELHDMNLEKASDWPYIFDLDPSVLEKIGKYVAASKKTIPTTFNAPYNNIFALSGGTSYHSVGYEKFMVFIVPAIIAPPYPDRIRKPLAGITNAAALALQRDELCKPDLNFIESQLLLRVLKRSIGCWFSKIALLRRVVDRTYK